MATIFHKWEILKCQIFYKYNIKYHLQRLFKLEELQIDITSAEFCITNFKLPSMINKCSMTGQEH